MRPRIFVPYRHTALKPAESYTHTHTHTHTCKLLREPRRSGAKAGGIKTFRLVMGVFFGDKYPIPRHSRECGDPLFIKSVAVKRRRPVIQWIPAFAGMTVLFLVFGAHAAPNPNILICPTGQGFAETPTGLECAACTNAPMHAQYLSWPADWVPPANCTGTECHMIANNCPWVCDPGYFLDGAACSPCLAGTFKAVAGNQACTWCGSGSGNNPGWYQPNTGQTECLRCPPNDWMPQYFGGYWSSSSGDGRHVQIASCRVSWGDIQLPTGTFNLNCAHSGDSGGFGYGDFDGTGPRIFCWPTSATCNPGYESLLATGGSWRMANRRDLEHYCRPIQCDSGVTRLRVGDLTIPLDKYKLSTRAINIQTAGGTCYVHLTQGQRSGGALNINMSGTVYHNTERCRIEIEAGWAQVLRCPWLSQ